MKFGVGQPVPRKEDPTLLRGQGRYTDDINLAGQAYAVMVRSRIAHGILKGIDATTASAMPGVLAILTSADLDAAGFGPLKCPMNIPQRDGSPMKTPPRPSLAKGKVRFVGEAVACVVAETAVQAKDAAEAVELDIEELPAVTAPARCAEAGRAADSRRRARQPGARLPLRQRRGGQDGLRRSRARHRLEIVSNRIVVNPMEPRVGDRLLRCRDASAGPASRLPGRHGPARRPRPRRAERDARQGARADRQCRRLVRHEVAGLSRVRPVAARRPAARPSGEMDRRALRELPERPPRPRPSAHRRAGARQGRQVPRGAAERHRQRRRLHLSADARDHQRGEEHHRRLQDAGDGSELQGRVHQHHADRRLSRRRPARGQLLHGAPDRHGGARDGHRPGRAASSQPHRARRRCPTRRHRA